MTLNISKKTGDKLTATEFNQVVDEVNKKVDVMPGKGLSTNDYTNEEKQQLANLGSLANVNIDDIYDAIGGKLSPGDVYSKLEVDAKVEEARIALNLTQEQLAGLNVNLTPITIELREINLWPLKGKKMLVLGDSLSSAGGGTMEAPAVGSWCQHVKTLLKLSADSRVIAQGGATCTDKNDTTIKPDKADWTGSNNVLSNQVYSMIKHYKANKGTVQEFVPDIIMIMIGTNNSHTTYPDPTWDTIVGDWATCMYSQFVDTDFDLYDLTVSTQLQKYNALRETRKKFYSAYKWAIEALLYWFPDASIYVLSPMANSGGRGQNVYEFTLPACRKIADFLSCGWIDVYSRCGLSYYSNTRKGNGWDSQWYTFDGTHPNFDAGMELVGRFVARELQNSYFVKPPVKSLKVPMSGEDVFYSVSIVNANADTSFGTTSPAGSQQVIKGGTLTVNILPASGHHVYSVKVNGVEQGSITTYTFSNVQSNQEIIVEFAVGEAPVETFTVTGQGNNTNHGTVIPASQSIQKGGVANLTATAKAGYVIDNWLGASDSTGAGTTSGTARVTNVQANKTVTCNFKEEGSTPPPVTGKTILSFGWPYADQGAVESGITKVHIGNISSSYVLPIGVVSLNGKGANSYSNLTGAMTGDNSGIYPDKFLERSITFTGDPSIVPLGDVSISNMENGTYRVGVLTNISSTAPWANYIASPSHVTIDINGISKNPCKITDNTDTLTVFDDVVVSDGVLRILLNISEVNKRCVINVIEIEKIG